MRTESSGTDSAGRLGTAPATTRVLAKLSSPGNQRVLVDWLQQQDQFELVPDEATSLPAVDVDVVVLDGQSLRTNLTKVRARKQDSDAFLPVLLVSSDDPIDAFEALDQIESISSVPTLVDEILTAPVDMAELRTRLATLARIRAQSFGLQRKSDQLLLLNRITRHDIRNDMNVIIGLTEQLGEHTDDHGEGIRQQVLESSQHVVELTTAVREFVDTLEMEGGPELVAIDLEDVLSDELAKRRTTFEDAEFVVDGEIPRMDVCGNDLLASVFRNVLNNAVQHNVSETPRVEISVEERDTAGTVTIVDNGPGIPSRHAKAILGRTDQGLDHPAAGLGLYLVDTIVSQYGGTVRIGDAELGGARIEIELQKAPSNQVNASDNDV